ncbi:MAG: hypothetical protein ACOYW7_08255 [Nitrospirota bacterium]
MKKYFPLFVICAAVVGLYLGFTDPRKIEVTGVDVNAVAAKKHAQTYNGTGDSTYGAASSQGDAAAPQHLSREELQAYIEKKLPGDKDDIEAKLALSETLYSNDYVPNAREVFNSISDEEMCQYIAQKTPGSSCEGDIRVALSEALYQEGRLKLAKDILTKMVSEAVAQMQTVELGAFQTLRMVYRNFGDLAKYDALVESIPEAHPLKAELLIDAARYYSEEGNLEKMNRILSVAANTYPNSSKISNFIDSMTAVEKTQ